MTSLYRFTTLDEALERANAVPFGLSASIFTRDLHAVHRFSEELQAGILHVNSQTAGADVHVPFGGLKGSGFGPHEQGRAALEFFTEAVTVYQDAPLDWPVSERFLVTGVLGCLGAWVARAALADGDEVVGYDLGEDTARLRLVLGDDAERVDARPRRHHRPRARSSGRSTSTRSRASSTSRRSRCRSSAPNPPLGMRVNVAGHGQRVRGRVATRLDRIPGVAYASSAAVYNRLRSLARARVGRDVAGDALRRLEARGRGHGARLRGRPRPPVDRPAPVRRLRARPRPGHDVGPDDGDAGGRARRAVRDRLHGHGAVRLRAGRRARVRPRGAAAGDGAAVYNVPGASPHRSRRSSRRSARSSPTPRSRASGDPLPFPPELEAVGFERDVGPFPRTPLAEGVAATIAHFRRQLPARARRRLG